MTFGCFTFDMQWRSGHLHNGRDIKALGWLILFVFAGTPTTSFLQYRQFIIANSPFAGTASLLGEF
jgi:hypothetical protein